MNYKISIDYDDYFANSQQFKAKNIEVVGDSIMFETDKETIDLIEEKNIRYMLHESKKDKLKGVMKYKTGIFFGLFFAIFFIVMNSYRVKEVKFNDNHPINEEINAYIENGSKKILMFNFHKNNYQDLAKDIRSFYPEYEWITISKKGSVVYVEIEQDNQVVKEKENNKSQTFDDMIRYVRESIIHDDKLKNKLKENHEQYKKDLISVEQFNTIKNKVKNDFVQLLLR